MFVIVWGFRVKHSHLADFKEAYRPDGDWALLFRKARGFIRTELLRDRDDRARFLTIDMWDSRGAYDDFRAGFDADYVALDGRTESFTDAEERIGIFETIDGESH